MPSESYEIGKVIGKGSYGQVSLARHKRDKKQVSLSGKSNFCHEVIKSILLFIELVYHFPA